MARRISCAAVRSRSVFHGLLSYGFGYAGFAAFADTDFILWYRGRKAKSAKRSLPKRGSNDNQLSGPPGPALRVTVPRTSYDSSCSARLPRRKGLPLRYPLRVTAQSGAVHRQNPIVVYLCSFNFILNPPGCGSWIQHTYDPVRSGVAVHHHVLVTPPQFPVHSRNHTSSST